MVNEDFFVYHNGELEGEGENVCLGYTSKPCINCSRVRVEQWSDGSKICEKCHYNQDKEKFEENYRKFI